MEQGSMGLLIRRLRKERNMTQRDLAEYLHVTDKAVSKWERNLSLPDVALLLPLAEALGVSVTELLGGSRPLDAPPPDPAGELLAYASRTAPRRRERLRLWLGAGLTGSCALAALVCWICDTALNGRLTWSLVVDLSLALAWGVSLPLFTARRRAGAWALAVLSAAVLPYLWLLGALLNHPEVFRFGLPIAPAAAGFLWLLRAAVLRLRRRPWLAGGAAWGLSSLLGLYIDAVVCALTESRPMWGDSLCALALAAACLLADSISRRGGEEAMQGDRSG